MKGIENTKRYKKEVGIQKITKEIIADGVVIQNAFTF